MEIKYLLYERRTFYGETPHDTWLKTEGFQVYDLGVGVYTTLNIPETVHYPNLLQYFHPWRHPNSTSSLSLVGERGTGV